MAAHAALASLKGAAIRHSINAIVADIYNVAAAYHRPFADVQKFALRQSGQNTMHRNKQCKLLAICASNDSFAVFAVNVQDVFCTKAMFLKPRVQLGHRNAPFLLIYL